MVFQLEMGNALLEPFRGRFALEMVVEELPHPDSVVSLIGWFSQPVILTLVLEHDHRFSEASQCVEVFDSLIPVHSTVFIVVKDNKWCFHLFCEINRGVSGVSLNVFPIAAFEPSLAALKDGLIG